MATKQVNIDIIAKDKTRQAMNSATKGVDGLKSSVFNLKNALIGLGAGVAIKSFIDVGKSVESLQLRLKFLFGSVQEGAKAFDVMSKFASRVPFSLEQIQAGSGNLAIVSKNADELAKMLEITGNVAGVVGLDFRTTAEQIQRSFTAGIASADIFRERGVRDMLGFSAGAKVSAKETAEAFERLFSGNGKFANATKDLAKTLEATFSMIGDTVFNFQKKVSESFFVGLKSEFGALDQALKDNQKTIDEIAKSIGQGLSTAVIATGEAVRFLADNFEIIKAIGIAVIVGKMATAFFNLAKSIGTAKLALVAFSKVSKTTVVGALIGITTALVATNEAIADSQDPYKKLNDLYERQKLALLNLEKATFLSEKSKRKELEIVNQLIEEEKKAIALYEQEIAGKKRKIIVSKEYQDTLKDELKKIEELKKKQEELNKKFITGAEIGQGTRLDSSMTGSELINPIDPLVEQLNTEFKLQEQMKQINEEKLQKIMENDELQVELARIKADKLLQIAHETAEKEKEIRKQVFDENFELIKSGKASEINLEKMSGKDKTDLAKKVGREALDQLAQSNRKAFQLNKAFRLGEAIMDTAGAVAKVLPNIPLAIAIGALGAIQIASISQQKFAGRRLGGRVNQGQPYMVGEAGAELIVPDRPSNVVPNNKLGSQQQVTVNFNISTVDARGFNELLVNSRGTIVNLINSAVNEKGKMAII